MEVFCIFFFFLIGGDGIFHESRFSVNFNYRRILMNRHRGERFADVKERQHNRHSGGSVIRFGLVLQLMSALNYTSLTEL